ncbi:Tetratricopeptide repeat-containing protein [Actinacidiphila yanglinensis]|uniref:Tetratricopeptide repeat-containing protein n=1 Tax=Actinacidiphila yanglinensis TaxID=310779 RepID=A0A1H6CZV7_9ACTN|nr:tetratricopeptide repeat protein [Actinacidiphila yanglinensis]SEG78681.1 Tetratricopeptide repeat-containing protein [Actinacidiphila yanglinensis]
MHSLVGQGRFAEAHALISDAFVERNGSAGYLLRAWVLAQEQRPADAREAVDWALAIASSAEAGDVFVLAGVVLLSLDEAHAALTVALRATGADPDGWEPSVLLSDVYRRLGRIPDAIAAARRAVALAPQEAEAQVALARSLSAGRGVFGRIPRRNRAEHRAAAERALMLGAAPGQLVVPRGGAVLGGMGLAVLLGVQLYRIETGGAWELVAAGIVFGVTFALIGVLVTMSSRRSGVSTRSRLRGVRATTRTEMVGDAWLWRIAAVHIAAVLPLPALLTTGLVADRAWRGAPWPLWAAALLAAAGLTAVSALLVAVPWWYGEMFARRILRHAGLVRLQLTATGLLIGGTLAVAVRGRVSTGTWASVALAHVVWTIGGWLAAAVLSGRLQVLRRRAL